MKKKRAVILTIMSMLLLNVCVFAETIKMVNLKLTYDGKIHDYSAPEVKVIVDGKELNNLDVQAVIIDNRTLVPVRAIFEAMGAGVKWDGQYQKITADFEKDTVIMFINNKAGLINDNSFNMDVPPKIINDRTMVPVRAIAEAVGASVSWNESTRTVNIVSSINDTGNTENTQNSGNTQGSEDINNTGSQNNVPVNPPQINNDEEMFKSDPNKVTDLSNAYMSEIDMSELADPKNQVKVIAVNNNGNDSYTIKTSGKIWSYRYATVLGKKVAVDIYGGEVAVPSANITVNDSPVEKIRVGQYSVKPYKVSRIVFDLTDKVDEYYVTKSDDGTSLIVNFGKVDNPPVDIPEIPDVSTSDDEINKPVEEKVNEINKIDCKQRGENDIVTIYGKEKIDCNVYTLPNPYRIMVDITNAKDKIDSIANLADLEYVKDIKVQTVDNRNIWVTIEVEEGAEFKESENENSISINITKEKKVEITQNIINDGKTIRFTKTKDLRVSDIKKNYDPYTGKTIISLSGNYGNIYQNKTLTYNNNDPKASYISSAVFNTSGGVTNITITPSLIAEFNIYENGDYIYIDLVDPKTVYDMVVVLDAGHGGSTPGAVVNGVYEKDITLDIAKKTYDQLKDNSKIKVYVTRFTDSYVDNYKRAYMANFGADMFISIHCNSISGNNNIHGTETLYAPHVGENNGRLTSNKLANELQNNIVKFAGTYDRGLKVRPELIVLKNTTVPAALIETGFMTNEKDMALITSNSGRQKFANAIAQTIKEISNNYTYR